MSRIFKKGWRPVLVLLLLFISWEMAVRKLNIEEWLLPSPTRVFNTALADWSNFAPHLQSTLKLSLLGFSIGLAFGIIVAVLLHLIPFFKESIYPLLILSQNVPVIVLAPLLVIWFGFGLMPKIIVITLVCFFPITVSALDGFRQTAPELRQYMNMAGASKRQLFWKLELPSALPSLFSGLKISATYSVMGAVISEWLGSKEGIGVYMTLSSASFNTDKVFVAIFAIMGLSLLFFAVILILERWLVRWQWKGDQER